METLALELSNILNVSFEKAIELLPMIRKQFLYYKIIGEFKGTMGVITLGCISALGMIAIVTFAHIMAEYDLSDIKIMKFLPKLFLITFISTLLTIIFSVSQYLLAPDFMILKEFILK